MLPGQRWHPSRHRAFCLSTSRLLSPITRNDLNRAGLGPLFEVVAPVSVSRPAHG